jgi:D-threo-aldose 1-dehydrogenase
MRNPGERRRIGKTDVTVTALGLGAASLGGWPDEMSQSDAETLIDLCWNAGIRYFDMAPLYGYGQAERFCAAGLTGRPRDEYTILTKVGLLLEPGPLPENNLYKTHETRFYPKFDFSRSAIRRSIEGSLARLGTDYVDIALLHDPQDHMTQAREEAFAELQSLKSEGIVRAVGAGMNYAAPLTELVTELDLDCLLVAGRYTLIEQSALDELIPAARRRGTSILAGGVYNSGILVDPKPGANYWYQTAPDDILNKALAIQRVCSRHGVSLGAAAIQFPHAIDCIASTVVGMQWPQHLADNVRNLTTPIPDALWADLRSEGLLPPTVPLPGLAD